MADSTERRAPWAEAFAGAGFGLLLGVIIGLSATPVVKDVILALTGLLAVFLGLQVGSGTDVPLVGNNRSHPARIGTFGLATAAGLVLGMFLRLANPFQEDPEIDATRWAKAFGDNTVLAHQAMLYERFGVEPELWRFDPSGEGSAAKINQAQADSQRGGLFGVLQRPNLCDDLDPYGSEAEAILSRYDKPDEIVLLKVAEKVRELPKEEQLGALEVAHTVFCALIDEARQEARE